MFHFIGKKTEAPGGWSRFAQVCSVCCWGAGPRKEGRGRGGYSGRWALSVGGSACFGLGLPGWTREQANSLLAGTATPVEVRGLLGRGVEEFLLGLQRDNEAQVNMQPGFIAGYSLGYQSFSHGGNVGCLYLRATRPPVRSVFFP